MIKSLFMPFISLLFLALAVAVRYTPVLIDWTVTPEPVQVLVSYVFVCLFMITIVLTGWRFFDSI